MAEVSTPVSAPAPARPRWKLFRWFAENPVVIKELRGRMRGRQAVFLLSGYLALIGLIVGIVYITVVARPPYSALDPEYRQSVGKAIFGTVVIMELLLVSFIAPSLCSSAITSERERQTFDLLRTTSLPASSLVMGKLVSALAYLLLLIFAALPIESIAFVLGGVGLEEIIGSTLLLVTTALFYCTLGMLFSSLMKRTVAATVSSYITIVVSYILLALAFFLLAFVSNSSGNVFEFLFTLVLWALVCTNPLLAAIVSEVILVSEQNLFFTNTFPSSGSGLILPSPWIPYIVLSVAVTVLMIRVSISFVRRPER